MHASIKCVEVNHSSNEAVPVDGVAHGDSVRSTRSGDLSLLMSTLEKLMGEIAAGAEGRYERVEVIFTTFGDVDLWSIFQIFCGISANSPRSCYDCNSNMLPTLGTNAIAKRSWRSTQ